MIADADARAIEVPWQASVTVMPQSLKLTRMVRVVSATRVSGDSPTLTSGGVVSSTVTLALQLDALPAASVAVYVSEVVPSG